MFCVYIYNMYKERGEGRRDRVMKQSSSPGLQSSSIRELTDFAKLFWPDIINWLYLLLLTFILIKIVFLELNLAVRDKSSFQLFKRGEKSMWFLKLNNMFFYGLFYIYRYLTRLTISCLLFCHSSVILFKSRITTRALSIISPCRQNYYECFFNQLFYWQFYIHMLKLKGSKAGRPGTRQWLGDECPSNFLKSVLKYICF